MVAAIKIQKLDLEDLENYKISLNIRLDSTW